MTGSRIAIRVTNMAILASSCIRLTPARRTVLGDPAFDRDDAIGIPNDGCLMPVLVISLLPRDLLSLTPGKNSALFSLISRVLKNGAGSTKDKTWTKYPSQKIFIHVGITLHLNSQ